MKAWAAGNDLTGFVITEECGCKATSTNESATAWVLVECPEHVAERTATNRERKAKHRARKTRRKRTR